MRGIIILVCWIALCGAAAAADTAKKSKAPKPPLLEKLSCRTGPNDHQARLIVEVVKGRPMEFAFYSRLGTRVCSVHGRRGDAFTQWEDADGISGKTEVKLLEGAAMLEYKPGFLRVRFEDVGRMRYCGMYGELNGTVEVTKSKSECGLDGVFE